MAIPWWGLGELIKAAIWHKRLVRAKQAIKDGLLDVLKAAKEGQGVDKILGLIRGKKAYGVGLLAVVVGVASLMGTSIPGLPAIDQGQALEIIVTGLATMFLRAGVAKVVPR
jgi:hypothetical protein